MKRAVWECISTGQVLPRSSHGVSVFDSRVFVFGGEHIARTPIDSALHVFHLGSKTWTARNAKGSVFPAPRVAHAQVVCGSRLWVFGGRQGVLMHEDPLNDVWHCSLAGDSDEVEWTQAETKNAPSARSFHQMVAVGSKLYVFGGCGKTGRFNDFHALDTTTLEWTALPASPDIKERGGASAASVGNSIVILGGFCGHELGDIHVFDVATSTWRSVTQSQLTPPRSVAGTCTLWGKACIFGGEVAPSSKGHQGAGNFLNQLVLFDPTTDAVQEVPSSESTTRPSTTPVARGWFGMAEIDSQSAVVFGGLTGDDETPCRLSDLLLLTLVDE
eukprot:c23007_g1_i1.p1 GENE.c23007_g1_i1~~c23007_g1_i1.p1  ORF type:complete len:330 (+),score=69.21 c23007_g1_i1:50-1039(+)